MYWCPSRSAMCYSGSVEGLLAEITDKCAFCELIIIIIITTTTI
jgi:hypothetical protein